MFLSSCHKWQEKMGRRNLVFDMCLKKNNQKMTKSEASKKYLFKPVCGLLYVFPFYKLKHLDLSHLPN